MKKKVLYNDIVRLFSFENLRSMGCLTEKPSSREKETHSTNAENSLNYFCVDGKNNWEEKVLFILVLPLSGLLCITRSGKTKISSTNQVELKYSPAW